MSTLGIILAVVGALFSGVAIYAAGYRHGWDAGEMEGWQDAYDRVRGRHE